MYARCQALVGIGVGRLAYYVVAVSSLDIGCGCRLAIDIGCVCAVSTQEMCSAFCYLINYGSSEGLRIFHFPLCGFRPVVRIHKIPASVSLSSAFARSRASAGLKDRLFLCLAGAGFGR